MSEEYTIPALRDQAEQLRKRADQVIAGAQAEAEKFRRAATEIDAIADRQMDKGPEPVFTMPCWNCNQPISQDALGWGHVRPDETACQVPGPDEHTATRTPAAGTVVDGPGVTGEVAS